MRPRGLISTLAGLAMLALTPAAHAGTANIDANIVDETQPVAVFLNYVAKPGEQNDLSVTYHDGHWLFHDAIAPVTTQSCSTIDEHTVDCNAGDGPISGDPEAAGLYGVTIDTGDGGDTIDTGPLSPRVDAIVKAGPGDDTVAVSGDGPRTTPRVQGDGGHDVITGSAVADWLEGGDGPDTITGGDGFDLLVAGRGTDSVSGGEGNDTLDDRGEESVADTFAGDGGHDVVSYFRRKRAVVVDLSTQSSSGGDTFTSVEGATGGDGADRLIGDAGPNNLDGSFGADTVRGAAGDDFVTGGYGADRISGGSGEDVLDSEDEGSNSDSKEVTERVRCGGGKDLATAHDGSDRLATDCEQASVRGDISTEYPTLVLQPLTLSAHRLGGLAVVCTPDALPKGCRGTVTALVRRGKRLVKIGEATVAAKPGQRVAARMELLPAAPGYLQRSGLHKLVIRVRLDVRRRTFVNGTEHDSTAHLRDRVTTFARR